MKAPDALKILRETERCSLYKQSNIAYKRKLIKLFLLSWFSVSFYVITHSHSIHLQHFEIAQWKAYQQTYTASEKLFLGEIECERSLTFYLFCMLQAKRGTSTSCAYSFDEPDGRSSAFVLFLKFLTSCRTPKSIITSSEPPGILTPGTSR
jgi:hypothetical protein